MPHTRARVDALVVLLSSAHLDSIMQTGLWVRLTTTAESVTQHSSQETVKLELIAQNKTLNPPYFCNPEVFQQFSSMLKNTVEVRKYRTEYLGNSRRKLCMFFDPQHKILIDVNANVQTLNLNRPYNFFKSTTLEVHIQTFQILTQRHSCGLNGCSGAVPTHSLTFMHTHKHSGHVQYSLNGVHVHSQAFTGCSILTQRHSHTLTSVQGPFSSDTNANFLIVTPLWVAFNDDSMAFMLTQWVFSLTHWHSCALNWYSEAIPTHSLAFTCSHKCSGGVQYMLSLFIYLKVQWMCFQICRAHKGPPNLLSISIECHFFSYDKQEEWEIMTSHLNRWLVGGLGVHPLDWQQKIRNYWKKLEKLTYRKNYLIERLIFSMYESA